MKPTPDEFTTRILLPQKNEIGDFPFAVLDASFMFRDDSDNMILEEWIKEAEALPDWDSSNNLTGWVGIGSVKFKETPSVGDYLSLAYIHPIWMLLLPTWSQALKEILLTPLT